MWRDPIVEEVRRVREEYAARYHYDIKAICRAARESEKKVTMRLSRCRQDLFPPTRQPMGSRAGRGRPINREGRAAIVGW